MQMRCNRLGRFAISEDTLRGNWRDLLVLFAQVVVVDARARWDRRTVEYTGYSDLFEELPDAFSAPNYEFTFTRNLDGRVDIKAEKSKDQNAL